jgi:pimeloyl-ACP methyl ester carboxylesterase
VFISFCIIIDYELNRILDIPKENTRLTRPTFFAGAKRDGVSTIETFLGGMQRACEEGGVELTFREMDSAHWIMLEKADEVNKELAAWLEGLGL